MKGIDDSEKSKYQYKALGFGVQANYSSSRIT